MLTPAITHLGTASNGASRARVKRFVRPRRLHRPTTHRAKAFLAAVTFALIAAVPGPAFAYTRNNLLQGQSLFQGYPGYDYLVSSNGTYTLIMQCDGNLVEYGPRGLGPNHAIWDTETHYSNCVSSPRYTLDMQLNDGNLVVNDHWYGRALWNSRTNEVGNPMKFLELRNDGHLVIVRNQYPVGVVWDNTWGPGKPGVSNLNLGHYFGGL